MLDELASRGSDVSESVDLGVAELELKISNFCPHGTEMGEGYRAMLGNRRWTTQCYIQESCRCARGGI